MLGVIYPRSSRIMNDVFYDDSTTTVSYIYISCIRIQYVKCEKNSMILIVWNIFLYCTAGPGSDDPELTESTAA